MASRGRLKTHAKEKARRARRGRWNVSACGGVSGGESESSRGRYLQRYPVLDLRQLEDQPASTAGRSRVVSLMRDSGVNRWPPRSHEHERVGRTGLRVLVADAETPAAVIDQELRAQLLQASAPSARGRAV